MANAYYAFFGSGVEAGCYDGRRDRQYDDDHDKEGKERRISDLASETREPAVAIAVLDRSDTREFAAADFGSLVIFVVADVHEWLEGKCERNVRRDVARVRAVRLILHAGSVATSVLPVSDPFGGDLHSEAWSIGGRDAAVLGGGHSGDAVDLF